MEYLRINELHKKLGIGKSTLFDWTNPKSPRYRADFPKPVKMGRLTFYLSTEVEEYMQKQALQRC